MNIIPESQTIYFDIRVRQSIQTSIINHDNLSEMDHA
jgi:hypothetical protein